MKISSIALSLLGPLILGLPLHAQSVAFVRNIPLPEHQPILPLRTDLAVTPSQYLVTEPQLWEMGPDDTNFQIIDGLLQGVVVSQTSFVMLYYDADRPTFAFFGHLDNVYKYDIYDLVLTGKFGKSIDGYDLAFSPFGAGHALLLTMDQATRGPDRTWKTNVYDYNLAGGPPTLILSGVDNGWNIQAASDGSFWILNNNYTQLEKFTLTSEGWASTTTLSISGTFDGTIALTASGEFILGDGLGGGSLLSSTGDVLQTFGPPSTAVFDTTGMGRPYVNVDANGLITVYANTNPGRVPAQGMYNQYQIVPEPATVALISLGALALLFRHRVIRPKGLANR